MFLAEIYLFQKSVFLPKRRGAQFGAGWSDSHAEISHGDPIGDKNDKIQNPPKLVFFKNAERNLEPDGPIFTRDLSW